MSDKDDLIVDLLQEVREDQKAHSTILIELQRDVEVNTKDLTEHKEGVQQNRKRIEELEKPGKALKFIKNLALKAGALAAASLAILKLLDKI